MKQYLSAASFILAILFAAIGMWMPPQGEIDGSTFDRRQKSSSSSPNSSSSAPPSSASKITLTS